MTRTTNARLAGSMFLFYIVTGIASLVLFNQATSGAAGIPAKLAAIAQHATSVRLTVLLTMCGFVSAVVIAVTIYALTRDVDRDLALLALCFRVTEGVIAAIASVRTLQLLAIATASAVAGTGVAASDTAATNALGGLLLQQGGWTASIAATCFVMGSTLYCYLFLRARNIPVALSWLGLLASLLLLVALPLELAGFIRVPFLMWIPMLVFELAFALWLLVKGVAPPNRATDNEAVART